jgi:molybdate/tungstate transport system ATP-binding protein
MIRVENLTVALPGFSLKDIDLQVRPGEAFALIGPTGAGKTLLLEAIVGAIPVTRGRICVDGRDMADLPPEQRRIGILYQDHALFPHLSVEENITYGRRYGAADLPPLAPLIERLGLSPLLQRRIHALSGGEKQRVALARSLAVGPAVLLLDEPLTALDPNFREDIRSLIKELHQDMGITLLMVTHDFSEAHFIAQRTAVLNRGRIEQVGSVEAVFSRPETAFVADFVGMKNIFPAQINGSTAHIGAMQLQCSRRGSGFRSVAIRPENISISRRARGDPSTNQLPGRLRRMINRGFYTDIWVDVGELSFRTIDSRGQRQRWAMAEGEPVYLTIAPEDVHLIG